MSNFVEQVIKTEAPTTPKKLATFIEEQVEQWQGLNPNASSPVQRKLINHLVGLWEATSLSAKDKAIQQIYNANTAMEVLSIALKNKIPLANLVATEARMIAMGVLSKTPVAVEVLIFDRSGELVGSANGW